MPKTTGTRRQKALELYERIKQGPSIFPRIGPGSDQPLSEAELQEAYHRWWNSWIKSDIIEYIPELKKNPPKED